MRHDSAVGHVTGRALYLDDMPMAPGALEAALVLSPHAHARIVRIDATRALAAPGVVAAIADADVPGENDIGPALKGEPPLAAGIVEHVGQPVAAIAARTLDEARAAAKLVDIEYETLPAILTVEAAMAGDEMVAPPQFIQRGDAAGCACQRAASPHGRGALRRPGSFLSRRPHRARHPGRRPRHARVSARPSIRPRCSTASRTCSACRSTP